MAWPVSYEKRLFFLFSGFLFDNEWGMEWMMHGISVEEREREGSWGNFSSPVPSSERERRDEGLFDKTRRAKKKKKKK